MADGDAHLARLLKHVHELYECAQALQDPHGRAACLQDLSAVSGLLAYKVPEQSPMAKHLTQERREVVADEINSAILRMLLSFANTIVQPLMGPMQIELAPLRSRISNFLFDIIPLSGTT
jgi:hypothetical protein